MKVLWCWRCKLEVPMLDEAEFAEIEPLYRDGLSHVKQYREQTGATLAEVPQAIRRLAPVLEAYERLTGFREENPNAIWHHRISIYGPPCRRCGKVLRTPVARKCFECGLVVGSDAPV